MGAPKQKAIFIQVEISKTTLKSTHVLNFEISQMLTKGEVNLQRDHMKYWISCTVIKLPLSAVHH